MPKFEGPRVAAMDAYVTMLAAMGKPGTKSASSMGTAIANGSSGICELVLEGKVSYEVGKKYFDQVMEFMRFGLPPDLRVSSGLMDYDAMLELHRTIVSKRSGAQLVKGGRPH